MTKAQTALYWREWSAAKKAGQLTDPDRYTLMEEALGRTDASSVGAGASPAPISSKNLTNEQLDKVLAAFRAISRPASLNSQLRQQAMPRTRLLHRIAEQMLILALFVEHPCKYAKSVLQDRFNTAFLEDLSADPELRKSKTGGFPIDDSELAMMRNTLAARLSKLRRKGILCAHGRARAQLFGLGHALRGTPEHPFDRLTEHDLNLMAGVPCHCAACAKKNPTPERVAEPANDNVPF